MAPARTLPEPLRLTVFTAEQARQAGLTRAQLRGPRVRRVFRGMYADAELGTGLATLLRAAAHLLPKGAAIGGLHAVHLWGLPLPLRDKARSQRVEDLVAAGLGRDAADLRETEEFLGQQPIQVYLPAGSRRDSRSYLDVSEVQLSRNHTRWFAGLRLLSPSRLFVELSADGWTLEQLVCFADAAVHAERTSEEALKLVVQWARKRRGVCRAREALTLMDSESESPMETLLRLVIVRGGLPVPQCNRDVYSGKRFVARPDLRYEEWRIAIEYDGAEHASSRRRSRDETRRVELRAAGWRVLTFTSHEVLVQPHIVLERVRSAIAERRAA